MSGKIQNLIAHSVMGCTNSKLPFSNAISFELKLILCVLCNRGNSSGCITPYLIVWKTELLIFFLIDNMEQILGNRFHQPTAYMVHYTIS